MYGCPQNIDDGLPSRLVNYFDRRGKEHSGFSGVIFMGLTLTLVSFSCTAPFVGGLLAAASGGTWIYPLLGMIVYSGAFARDDLIQATGSVDKILGGGRYQITLESGQLVTAQLSGRMRRFRIRVPIEIFPQKNPRSHSPGIRHPRLNGMDSGKHLECYR